MHKGWGIIGMVVVGGFAACGGGTPPAATAPVATEALGEGTGSAPLPPDDAGVDAPASTAAAPAAPWTTLTKNLHGSSALAVDKSSVYWINESDGALQRIPKHGGITMDLYSGTGTAFQPGASIAVDATDVFWTSATVAGGSKSNTLTRQDKNGGRPSVVASSPVSSLQCVVVDDTSMYWVQGNAIMKASKNGGPAVGIAGGQTEANCVAVDDKLVYWSISGTEKGQFADGAIVSSPKAGGSAKVVVKGAERANNVLVDDKNVYWQNLDKIMKAPKTGGAEAVLAPAGGPIGDIAIDGGYVYFTVPGTSGDGTVGRVSKDGGTPTILATGQPLPDGIVVDDTSVYWTCQGTDANQHKDGSIVRLDKP
jgi:hypothetical protein